MGIMHPHVMKHFNKIGEMGRISCSSSQSNGGSDKSTKIDHIAMGQDNICPGKTLTSNLNGPI